MSSEQEAFEALARSLSAIGDHALRASYLRHHVLGLSAEALADLFSRAMASARNHVTAQRELLQSLSLALADESCDGLREAASGVLLARDHPMLALALTRGPAGVEDPETQRIPDFGKGRHVSLGERKSLARGHNRELIARCLRDPHPAVMRILLGNPIVTETDLIRLCARRPISTEVLREVSRSWRWIIRYPVKVALALNPHTPLDIGLQLLPLLNSQDLRRLCASQELRLELREVAAAEHQARKQTPAPG